MSIPLIKLYQIYYFIFNGIKPNRELKHKQFDYDIYYQQMLFGVQIKAPWPFPCPALTFRPYPMPHFLPFLQSLLICPQQLTSSPQHSFQLYLWHLQSSQPCPKLNFSSFLYLLSTYQPPLISSPKHSFSFFPYFRLIFPFLISTYLLPPISYPQQNVAIFLFPSAIYLLSPPSSPQRSSISFDPKTSPAPSNLSTFPEYQPQTPWPNQQLHMPLSPLSYQSAKIQDGQFFQDRLTWHELPPIFQSLNNLQKVRPSYQQSKNQTRPLSQITGCPDHRGAASQRKDHHEANHEDYNAPPPRHIHRSNHHIHGCACRVQSLGSIP